MKIPTAKTLLGIPAHTPLIIPTPFSVIPANAGIQKLLRLLWGLLVSGADNRRVASLSKAKVHWGIALLTAATLLNPAVFVSAQTAPVVHQETRAGMGENKFDANQTEKYTVSVTNGNLYVKQTDFVIPSSRGPSIEVTRTYNSRNFDYPRLFGKGNWSFSLNKFLGDQQYYRCTNTGDMEDIEVGDLLEEKPVYDKPDCCNDDPSGWDCCQDDPSGWDCCQDDPSGWDCCQDDPNGWDCCQDDPSSWGCCSWDPDSGCCDSEADLRAYCDCCDWYIYCDFECAAQSDWDGCFDYCIDDNCSECDDSDIMDFCDWGDCSEDCDCALDGLDCNDCGQCVCEDEYGNDVCDMCDGRDCTCEDEYGDQNCDVCDGRDCTCEDEYGDPNCDVCDGRNCTCEDEYGDQNCDMCDGRDCTCEDENGDSDCDMCDGRDCTCVDEDGNSNCDEICDFNVGDYDDVTGYLFHNGDGDAVMVFDESMAANENPYHLEVEDAQYSGVKFKDGTIYTFENGIKGNIVSMADRYGNAVTFLYDQYGRPATVTDAVGRQVSIAYNGDGFISSITALLGTPEQRTMSFNYEDGYLTQVVNFDNKLTSYEYYTGDPSKARLLKKITDANGYSIHFEYVGDGMCTRVHKDQDQAWHVIGDTRYLYDEKNNLTRINSITNSGTYQTVKHWNEIENQNDYAQKLITQIDDPYGKVTSYEYDDMFHLTKTTDTNGLVHEMTYDNKGNMLSKTADPGGGNYTTYWSYEPLFNQVTSITDANLHTKHYYYVGDGQGGGGGHGPNGVLWKEVDAEGNTFEHWYNNYGQRIETHDANGNVTQYEYNSNQLWNLTKVRKYGPITQYNPIGYFEATYTYDRWGNKTGETDFNVNLTEYGYDSMNRLTSKTVHDQGQPYQPFVTSYTYYDNGSKHTMTDPRGYITKYFYDSADRLTQVTESFEQPEERTTWYGYDTESNKTSETDPNNHTTSFQYDVLNRLTDKIEPLDKKTKYFYGGGGDSSTDGGSQEYTRKKDRYTQMTQWREKEDRSGSTWISTDYHYDKIYRIEWVRDDKGGYTRYEYDAVGNKTAEIDAELRRTEYIYWPRNLLWKIIDHYSKEIVYTYDAMGNKASEKDKNNHYTYYEYTHDRNLLTKVTDHLGHDIEYTYDGTNKRKEQDKKGNVTHLNTMLGISSRGLCGRRAIRHTMGTIRMGIRRSRPIRTATAFPTPMTA